jgi:hypothetical protein
MGVTDFAEKADDAMRENRRWKIVELLLVKVAH